MKVVVILVLFSWILLINRSFKHTHNWIITLSFPFLSRQFFLCVSFSQASPTTSYAPQLHRFSCAFHFPCHTRSNDKRLNSFAFNRFSRFKQPQQQQQQKIQRTSRPKTMWKAVHRVSDISFIQSVCVSVGEWLKMRSMACAKCKNNV